MFPILFRWEGFSLHAYGLFMAAGFLSGIGLALKEARRQGIPGERILDLALYVIIAALLGSRLFYVAINYPLYREDPWALLRFWEGGLVFFGGFMAALIVGIGYILQEGLPLWKTADTVAPSIALGQVFGRLGCLAAGCCFGRPTTLPWAVRFTHPEALAPLGVPLHPTQLYEALAALFIFLLLLFLRRIDFFSGQILAAYLFLSGWARLLIEFCRGDYRGNLIGGPWSDTQYISGLLIIFSLILAFYRLNRKEKPG